MEIKKVNLDRAKLTSAHIQEKQDFNKVLKDARLTKTPTFKSPWFYGAVGLSSVAVATMMFKDFDNKIEKNEKKATQLISDKKAKQDPLILASAYPAGNISGQPVEQKKNSTSVRSSSIEKPRVDSSQPLNEIVNDVPLSSKPEYPEVKYRSEFPTINGLSSGKLSVSELLKAEKIEIAEEIKIVSYEVQYFNGKSDLSVQISGNVLPKNIREEISNHNLGQMIFFTQIKGLTGDGKLKVLPSMNFKIVSN